VKEKHPLAELLVDDLAPTGERRHTVGDEAINGCVGQAEILEHAGTEAEVPAFIVDHQLEAAPKARQLDAFEELEHGELPCGEHDSLEDHVVEADRLCQQPAPGPEAARDGRQLVFEQGAEPLSRHRAKGRAPPFGAVAGHLCHLCRNAIEEACVSRLVRRLCAEAGGAIRDASRRGEGLELIGDRGLADAESCQQPQQAAARGPQCRPTLRVEGEVDPALIPSPPGRDPEEVVVVGKEHASRSLHYPRPRRRMQGERRGVSRGQR
jgi:hypothetical protein